ncbi:MAG: type I DNA topoisomerase [Nanoarchaeota archaeon]|nr:type I DNA topoisomerase [Nanoarchaeota archaeon]
MAKKLPQTLVIVESPTKANTIGKFLGSGYKVESSFGHVRDLPKSKIGIDIEGGTYEPQYVIPTKVRKRVTALKKEAASAGAVILATDEDREGEAIAWHLVQALGLNKEDPSTGSGHSIQRIVFHEITKSAILEALEHPRDIDIHLVDAQQARRILDRLVGYQLSPFLWKKVFRGLSAGRVQSVALRLIADREEERKAFKAEEYWSLGALLQARGQTRNPPAGGTRTDAETFFAGLYAIEDAQVGKMSIKTKEEAEKIKKDLEASAYSVFSVDKKERKRNPFPPFTTSTLQQEASRKFRMSAKQTMRLAQGLYENGHITYMRTDSVNLSKESLQAAKEWIHGSFGERYALCAPRAYTGKSRLAQEAHEAIRPTRPDFSPQDFGGQASGLEQKEAKLYELIWRRFIASQLPPAEFDATTIDVLGSPSAPEAHPPSAETGSGNNGQKYTLRATGSILKFDGFLKVWKSKISENELPEVAKDDDLDLSEVQTEQHFTEPPPRYTEASLIKTLEENGIGRPSTYAPTISVIQTRNYVEKDEARRFMPTETGTLVNNLLKEHFPQIVDIGFTAKLEGDLDEVAEGREDWRELIRNFHKPFAELLEKKYEEVKKQEAPVETTDEICVKCGKPMAVKMGRFGKFLACTGFPECKSTKKLITAKESLGPCSECKEGVIVMKRTKTRRFFYGCSKYPDCTYASWKKPDEVKAKEDALTE